MNIYPAFRTNGVLLVGPSANGSIGQALLSDGTGGSIFGDIASTHVTGLGTLSGLNSVAFANLAAGVADNDPMLAGNSAAALPTQQATRAYVDNLVTGLQWKTAVVAATTANGTLATAYANGQTIDGVVLATGNRILLKNQTTATENGIYVVAASGAPTRASDSDTGAELVNATVFVRSGTTNSDTQWTCTNDAITLGSTSIVFAQVSGAGTYSNGAGLALSGNQFSVATGGVTNGMLAGSIAGSKLVLTDITTLANLSLPYGQVTGTPSIPASANPSASVGLTAVNGSGTAYMLANAAPALSQAIAPVWTAQHIWQLANAAAVSIGPNGDTNPTLRLVTNVSNAATGVSITGRAAAGGVTIGVLSSGSNEPLILAPKGTGGVAFSGLAAGNQLLNLFSNGFGAAAMGLSIGTGASGNTSFHVGAIGVSQGQTSDAGNTICLVAASGGFITVGSGGGIGFSASSSGDIATLNSRDTNLLRTAACVLALTDGNTTGNPGFGLQAKSTTTNARDRFRLTTAAADNTDATRKYRAIFSAYDTAAREAMRIEASGTVAMIGFLGATAAIQQTGGAATASLVYTATEQTMIQKAYDCLRTFGLLN